MPLASFVLQVIGWLIGLPLQALVISALLRGAYKRFPLLLAYVSAGLISTVIEIPANVQWFITQDDAVALRFAKIYWWDEIILLVLVVALVLSLLDRATSKMRSRRMVRVCAIAGTLIVAGISFYLHRSPHLGRTMTLMMRDLNFGAAILDVLLWVMLIAARHPDQKLLLVSGALGMQFTGEAIGQAVRDMSLARRIQLVSSIGSVIVMLADLACLYLWWRAFRRDKKDAAR
jgi:hypothetical protein